MTVTYTREVATSKGFSCFLKLLARWRGSIYKLVYIELIIFLCLFYTLHFTYIYILNDHLKLKFQEISRYCRQNTTLIPLSFVLGFYVSIVMARWWNQYCSIPFPDSIAVYVSATIHGQDERGRIMRRTIVRYVCLAVTMLFTNISSKVKKRFPTLDHLVTAGLLETNEKEVLDGVNKRSPKYSKHWMPLVWAASIVTRARKEGRIRDDFAVKTMLDELNKFRGKCGLLVTYDYISIPLVYTQVVTLAVYTYFLATLMGHQDLIQKEDETENFSLPFPFFTTMQFFFYMGWLKVAESLINPFGDDDDDFDLNWMVDRNIQISYLIVDEMHHEHPQLIKDQYWDNIFPEQLPYTPETAAYRELYPVASTADIYNHMYEDIESSPIMFSAKMSSKHASQHSLANSTKNSGRKLSISSLRKFFPRSDSHSSVADVELLENIPKKLIEDVIEEVDEQLTIMGKREEQKRANIMDIFKVENEKSNTKLEQNSEAMVLNNDFELNSRSGGDERQEDRLIRVKNNLTHYLNNTKEYHDKNKDIWDCSLQSQSSINMTVTYTSEVTTSRGISCFLRLLARWKGSIYKIVWIDLILFLALYYAINLTYLYLPDSTSKENFKTVIIYCNKYSSLIPLSFVLGFYVNLVMSRWWSQYTSIPFPDNLAIIIGASIKGQDDRARVVRRTIMRYVCVTFTITLTMLSPKVKKRFPTNEHFVKAGLLTKDEIKIMEDMDNEFPSYSKYWLPLAWAANIVTRARHEGLIRDDVSIKTILEEMNLFRSRCGGMLDYDWISIPLVYTQVVTIAVYSYFIIAAIGRQYIGAEGDGSIIDRYFPFITVLEYFFYMGWLKVAEVLINPYGEDDDDFEVVWMVDRHLQVSYLLVDKIHQEHPKLMKDMHWSETAPNVLPHTVASQAYIQEYPVPSTLKVNVKKTDQDIIQPIAEDITEADGTRRRSGPYLWKVYSQLRKKHNLKKVTSQHPLEVVLENDSDTNDYDARIAINVPRRRTLSPEFEQLKKARQKQRQERLQRLTQILRGSREQLIEFIDKE